MNSVSISVQQLYVAFFGRPAEPAGMAFWVEQLAAGRVTLERVAQEFSQQYEHQSSLYDAGEGGFLQPTLVEVIVARTYTKLFGHAPDAESQYYWTKAMVDQGLSTVDMTLAMFNSAQGNDRIAFESKVGAANAFTDWTTQLSAPSVFTGPGGVSASEFMLAKVVSPASMFVFIETFKGTPEIQIIPATPYTLSIAGTTVQEGNSGVRTAVFSVTLNKAPTHDLTINFHTVDGTALAGQDYTASSGKVLFKAGQTVAKITVTIVSDLTPEATEAFAMRFSGPGLVVEATGNVTITDFDNTVPVFQSAATATIVENLARTTLLYQASAKDSDPGDSVHYSLKQGSDTGVRIDYLTGAVTLRAPANFELKSSYEFTVVATDQRGFSTEKVVTAKVVDANDAPVIGGGAAKVYLAASSAAGRVVYAANASDEDAGTALTYRLAGADAALFEVGANGVVSLKQALSGPVKPVYSFDLIASDGIASTTKTVAVFSAEAAVQASFVAFFGRPGDSAGVRYWTEALSNGGMTLEGLAGEFARSAEHRSDFTDAAGTTLSAHHIVDQVYLNLFGRHAESAGLHYWGQALEKQQVTIAQFVSAVLDGAQGADLAAFSAKVLGAAKFSAAVTAAGLDAGYAAMNLEVGARFLQSSMDQAALDAALAQFGNPGPVPPAASYQLSAWSSAVMEGYFGNRTMEFTLTLDRAATSELSFDYATADLSATAGLDYIAASGKIVFAVGQRSATLILQTIADDTPELTESFALHFASAALKWQFSTVGVISDNLIDQMELVPLVPAGQFPDCGTPNNVGLVGIPQPGPDGF